MGTTPITFNGVTYNISNNLAELWCKVLTDIEGVSITLTNKTNPQGGGGE